MLKEQGNNSKLHWPEIAQRWAQLGPPLRPSPADAEFYAKSLKRWTEGAGMPPRALIMGVTIEIYHLPWPTGTQLLAIDHTEAMIHAVWAGPLEQAVCGDWKAMPLATESRDVVLCDGGITTLRYPDETRRMIESLERVLAPGGICTFRLYVPPSEKEGPEAVLQDLLGGRVANLNVLKLRLGMAMQTDVHDGVELRSIWNAIHDTAPDFERLASQIGWKLEHLVTIDTYRDSRVRYYFPTEAQVLDAFEERNGALRLEETHRSTYVLGERCPMITLRKMVNSPRAAR